MERPPPPHAVPPRPASVSQVESLGGRFLKVESDFEEDGSGAGGYARETSGTYKAAERALMLNATARCWARAAMPPPPHLHSPTILRLRLSILLHSP